MEQVGTAYKGSTTFKNLFKSSMGPLDVIACVLKGNAAKVYPMGAAMYDDGSNAGCKKRYTNGDTTVKGEAVGNGDTVETAFDLDHAGVIPGTLSVTVNAVVTLCTLSKGTGTGGVDQVVFNSAPAAQAIVANYMYAPPGACILMTDQETVVGGPNITADACRDGSVDKAMVVDDGGDPVDAAFVAALPRVSFD